MLVWYSSNVGNVFMEIDTLLTPRVALSSFLPSSVTTTKLAKQLSPLFPLLIPLHQRLLVPAK
jgi:hypothetical protein